MVATNVNGLLVALKKYKSNSKEARKIRKQLRDAGHSIRKEKKTKGKE